MIIRKPKSPKLTEVEKKIQDLRSVLENKSPRMSEKEIENLIYFMLKQNYNK